METTEFSVTGTSDTVAWSGGTPAGATIFTGLENVTTNNSSQDRRCSLWWAQASTGALSNVSVDVASSSATASAGARLVYIYSIAGSSGVGQHGNVNANVNGQLSVALAGFAANSLVVGSLWEYDSATIPTAGANSVFDNSVSTPSWTTGAGAAFHSSAMTSPWGSGTSYIGRLAVAVEMLAAASTGTLAESATPDILFDVYGPVRFVQRTAFQPNAFQEDAYQILGGTTGAAGGNTYNEGDTASALAQDLLQAAQGFAQPDTHSALAQDQLVAALGWNAVISEASLAQDLLNGAQGAPGSLSELAKAAEQLATAAGFTAFGAENAPAQEQLNTAQGMLAAFADSALAQDVALPALQMPVGMEYVALADVLFDSTLLRPGTGSQYDESLIEACAAREALAGAQGAGGGVEAKIGGAGATAGTSIFVFDD